MTWSKAGGADADVFTVSVSGDVALGSTKDFEEPDDADADGTYELSVQVSDGVNDVTADLLVRLDNVIELEDIEGPSSVNFAEKSWSRVATFTASSQQDRDGISWVLGGSDAARFTIDDPPARCGSTSIRRCRLSSRSRRISRRPRTATPTTPMW